LTEPTLFRDFRLCKSGVMAVSESNRAIPKVWLVGSKSMSSWLERWRHRQRDLAQGADADLSAAVRSLQPTAHVPDAAGWIGLRHLDARTDRGTQLDCDFCSVRPSLSRFSLGSSRKVGWAQNWAQR